MPDLFPVFFAAALLAFAGVGLLLLLRPSVFLHKFPNPWQPNTIWNRVQMRAVGLYFCLFVLLPISGSQKGFGGFQRNLVIALLSSPVLLAISFWAIWRYSSVQRVIRRQLTGEQLDDRLLELRMSLAFGGLLFLILFVAFVLR
jgi:hypothetical protein